jgi:protein SCO1/2
MHAFAQLRKAGLALAALTVLGSFADVFAGGADPHQHHRMTANGNSVSVGPTRSIAAYQLPQIQLLRADGKAVALPAELDDGRPVVLNFIFTTCTAICPISSQVFSEVQARLGKTPNVHLVSISIDPEQDTPAVLRRYAQRFGAGTAWDFYTGTVDASIAAQKAFGVYRGDKMNHTQVTLVRPSMKKPWIRLDGFASAEQLVLALNQETSK